MDGETIGLLAIFVPHAVGGVVLGWRLLPKGARDELASWWRDADDGDGGLRRPRPSAPRGGDDGAPLPDPIPLPDAAPAGVRLREPGRLADRRPAPERRPHHEPLPVPERRPVQR
ncbi:hypothetical protein SK069_02590 [Patulibacter brassicae]|uniref:Uncharacterized protein n=1 Tax=Patulibacter brassicae TaxID=1705717 RepID=A0ABU4VHS0_9ACTN|nr:hypothetical protein [Patulibacter brassicae]MDX8150468.1 hypothetical protein [Patulibacter brassicae]